MSGTGSVERILVGGILVVVLAILGIASWSATGSEDDASPAVATDGGVTDGGSSTSVVANGKAGAKPKTAAERLAKLRADNQKVARERQDLAASWVDGTASGQDPGGRAERQAQAKTRQPRGPRAVGPPAAIETEKSGPQGVPLRSNGKPHTSEADKTGPVQPLRLPKPTPGALGDWEDDVRHAAAAKPEVYLVQEGDTLWGIVKRTYGEGDVQRMVDLLLQANPTVDPDFIRAGQTLALPTLPGKSSLVTPSPAQQATGDESVNLYEVRDGDSLSRIAASQLGSSGRWKEIYDLNRRRLASPDRVLPGMTLLLPQK